MKTLKHYLKFAMPVIATVAMLFASCSSDKEDKASDILVPKNAYFVANVNLGNLWTKGGLNNFESLQCYSLIGEGINELPTKYRNLVLNLLKDPSTSGIDTDKDILVYITKTKGAPILVITAPLKGKQQFADFVKTLQDLAEFPQKASSGVTYISFDKDVTLAYNDKNLAVVCALDDGSRKHLEGYASHIFSLKAGESIVSDRNFNEYWNNRKDLGFFLPFGTLLNDKDLAYLFNLNESMKGLTADQLNKLKNAAVGYTLSFENGSIDMKQLSLGYPVDANTFGNGISATLLKFMPSKTLAAASISLNMASFIKNFEENPQYREILNTEIEGMPYTVRDIINAFGGNVVANFYGMNHNTPLFAVAADVNDYNLVSNLVSKNSIESHNNVYLINNDIPLFLYLDDNTIALTNDATAAETYTMGGYSNGLGDVAANASKGNYLFLDLNLLNYPTALLDMIGYRGDDPTLNQILSLLDKLEVTTNKNDYTVTSRINLNTSNNSLAEIVRIIDMLIYNEIINATHHSIAYDDSEYYDYD